MSQQEWDEKEVESLKKLVGITNQIAKEKDLPSILPKEQDIKLQNAPAIKHLVFNFVSANGLVEDLSVKLNEALIESKLLEKVREVKLDLEKYTSKTSENRQIPTQKPGKGRGPNAPL